MTKLIGVLFSMLFILISSNIYAYSNSSHEIPQKLTISFTGKSCIKVEKNYFYNTCIKNGSIQVAIKKPLPANSLFYLNVMDGKTKKIKDLNSLIQKNYKATCKVNEPSNLEVKIENKYVNIGLYDKGIGKYNLKEFH